jgi:hypothetical protein
MQQLQERGPWFGRNLNKMIDFRAFTIKVEKQNHNLPIYN